MKCVSIGGIVMATTLVISTPVVAQPGGGCSPATTNGTCGTAVALVLNGPCVNGTTCAGGTQSASSCLYAGSQCTWYSFTATATNMYVSIDVTATSGCHISSNVYRAAGSCSGLTEVSCQSGAPLDDLHALSGLVIGGLYYVQVCYAPGGPCGNGGSAQFCIQAGVPDPPCGTCGSPCGTATGYQTTPTVQQVVEDCQTTPFSPALQPLTAQRFCYSFTATNPNVNFNVIITSNCSGGNVSSFSWDLHDFPSCGSPIQSGTLASLSFTGLVVGNDYVFCYGFTVPSNCTHSQHCPYFVGASVPLPVTWLAIEARVVDDGVVGVEWITATEQNSDHFTVERSIDAASFHAIGRLEGAGDSHIPITYRHWDRDPIRGLSYYRIRQTDHDGSFSFSRTVPVELIPGLNEVVIAPNPMTVDAILTFSSSSEDIVMLDILDASGRILISHKIDVRSGYNSIPLDTGRLAKGTYTLSLGSIDVRNMIRFVKE
jgi:hypothetical protein